MTPVPQIIEPKPMSHKLLMVIVIALFAAQTVLFKKEIHSVRTQLDTFAFTHKNNPNDNHLEITDLEQRIEILEKEISALKGLE